MLIIPAIDLKNGKCVRLLQGRADATTEYSDNPVEMAKRWASLGARLIHIVDLDGAFTGDQKNIESIKEIRKAVTLDIEVGGGIRDMERIEMLLGLGINRVILGTVAIERPELVKEACKRFPERIIAGIDARDGRVAIKGWVETTDIKATELALRMQDYGVWGIIYTDISRDGMLTGPNIPTIKEMVETVNIPVIASGGVSSIDDIKRLKEIKGLYGVITGKALYTGAIDLKEAIKIVMGDE
ncbi:MAG: 1-(5-phosphoribosyl)-5-[(5-phosphoribosylamino)methylideneamino]imidazole-4-carboxamide isomerase [Thermodesulfovibrionales bacterium]